MDYVFIVYLFNDVHYNKSVIEIEIDIILIILIAVLQLRFISFIFSIHNLSQFTYKQTLGTNDTAISSQH